MLFVLRFIKRANFGSLIFLYIIAKESRKTIKTYFFKNERYK